MAESREKTLEMRVAELEDKLAKLHITEEEMRAYEKVSAMLGGQAGEQAGLSPQVSEIPRSRFICIRRGIIPRFRMRDVECTCGPCNCDIGGGGVMGGGGFGGFGM
jgi:hypothetical protein